MSAEAQILATRNPQRVYPELVEGQYAILNTKYKILDTNYYAKQTQFTGS